MKVSYLIVNHGELILLRFNLWRVPLFIFYFMILTFDLYQYLYEYSLDSFNVRCFLNKIWYEYEFPFHFIKPLFSYDYIVKYLFKNIKFLFSLIFNVDLKIWRKYVRFLLDRFRHEYSRDIDDKELDWDRW